MQKKLKETVCCANLELQKQNLVICSWGNVSGIDRSTGIIAIKPSGVSYDELTPGKMVLVDLQGNVIKGSLRPSSDTLTHLELYRNFAEVGGICHTHSTYATIWAQACKSIPPLGTTGADYFYGEVPTTRTLTNEEINSNYELNTGKVIVETFSKIKADPIQMPAVLAACHGPFTWGEDCHKAVENAVVLENIAKLAFGTVMLNPDIKNVSDTILNKHFLRKHGANAYYGQKF